MPRCGRSSSTSSAASRAATRSRGGSCRRSARWRSAIPSWCGWTAPTPRKAARSSQTPGPRTCTSSRRCSRGPSEQWSSRREASLAMPIEGPCRLCRCGRLDPGLGSSPAAVGVDDSMSDVWSARAEAFRASEPHREGADLDLVVEWCEPGEGVKALDVATGGGHVARRLREEGCEVVTVDPAPGMKPDVISRAEDLPFADESFDVVVCRIAAHHFPEIEAAVAEMARVSQRLLVIDDLLFDGEDVEEAHRLRDPTHVRSYTEDEWRELLGANGFEVEQVETFAERR